MAGHSLATISNPSSALTDFTLIVDLSNMPANWWSAVTSSDGTRGRVYKGDGSTRLACDWIAFDDTAETGLLRVLWSGTLASTGTQQLWIEPPVSGNAAVAANDTYGSDNAYDSSWVGYWPLQNDFADRTANGNDGSGQGGISAGGVSGQIGNGTVFDGTDDYISVANDASLNFGSATDFTIVGWTAISNGNDGGGIITKGGASDSDQGYGVYFTEGQDGWARISNGDDVYESIAAVENESWHQYVATFDRDGNLSTYTDGGTANGTGDISSVGDCDTTNALLIGNQTATRGVGTHSLQEIQLHAALRSAAWINEEYDQTSDNSTFWGAWTWSGGGGTDALTANDLLSGTPVLGSPAIGQEHRLLADSVLTGSPVLGEPAIGQIHALTATGIITGSPVLGEPAIGQIHVLVPDSLVSGNPVLGSPTLSEVVDLIANDLVAGAPVLGSPALGTIHVLQAENLLTGAPVLGAPAIGQTHVLGADDLVSGAPILGEPTLSFVLLEATREYFTMSISIEQDNKVIFSDTITRKIEIDDTLALSARWKGGHK